MGTERYSIVLLRANNGLPIPWPEFSRMSGFTLSAITASQRDSSKSYSSIGGFDVKASYLKPLILTDWNGNFLEALAEERQLSLRSPAPARR